MEGELNILLIDDDSSILQSLALYLEEEGFVVFKYGNAKEAMATLETVDYDVIVTDMRMPHMTGAEVLDCAVRARPELPVILMTAFADMETAIETLKRGAFDFILKPFDPFVLVKSIRNAMTIKKFAQHEREHKRAMEAAVIDVSRKLVASMEEIRAGKVRAEEALRLKSEILANLNHEVRTPLNGIIGFSELAMGCNISGDLKSYVSTIRKSALDLMELLSRLLELSGAEAPAPKATDCALFDIRATVFDVIRKHSDRAALGGIQLDYNVSDDFPLVICGDETGFVRMLDELLCNAIKFTPRGSVKVNLTMIDRLTPNDIRASIEVTDTGIGIEADKLNEIFEDFRQVDGSSTRKYGGLGIGLALAGNAARRLGGEIAVNSEPGHGSRFTATMNLRHVS